MTKPDLPLLTFADAAAFERWLDNNGASAPGAWLRFAKMGAPETTISKSDAIDCALAYGWVDGQLGRVDEHFHKVRFTPRRPRSAWSQVNRERVGALERAGRMRPAGVAQVEQAKADGRRAAAYAPQSEAEPDSDLEAALGRSKEPGNVQCLEQASRRRTRRGSLHCPRFDGAVRFGFTRRRARCRRRKTRSVVVRPA